MINIFNKCSLIERALNSLKEDNEFNFRIWLRTNENLYVYIQCEDEDINSKIKNEIYKIYENTEIEFLPKNEDESNFYKNIFSSTETINIETGRRRFDSLLKKNNITINHKSPIVSFYSYKGGMGRSTTLAAFAMHLALVENLNVIIIDCDFEAPGFTNFFLKNAGEENQRQGFIEYILDKESGLSSSD